MYLHSVVEVIPIYYPTLQFTVDLKLFFFFCTYNGDYKSDKVCEKLCYNDYIYDIHCVLKSILVNQK